MPNHCGTTLFVIARTDDIDDILDAMEGPIDWFFPESLHHTMAQTVAILETGSEQAAYHQVHGAQPLGGHKQLELHARVAALTEGKVDDVDWRAERNKRLGWDQPAWLPLTNGCILRMAIDPNWPEATPIAPLSMPRLLGGTDPETDTDLAEETLVGICGDLTAYERSWGPEGPRRDVHIPFRTSVLGTKWGIYDPVFDRDDHVLTLADSEWSVAVLRYTTAWGPLLNLEEALTPLLVGKDASVFFTWDDEGGSCGYGFFHPDAGVSDNDGIELTGPEEPDPLDEDEENDPDAVAAAEEAQALFESEQEAFWQNKPLILLEKAEDAVDDDRVRQAVQAYIDAHWASNDPPEET
jgi:hypothetical protein